MEQTQPNVKLYDWAFYLVLQLFFVLVSHLNQYLHTKSETMEKKTLLHNFCCIYWVTSDFFSISSQADQGGKRQIPPLPPPFSPSKGWEGEWTQEKFGHFHL